MPETESYQKHRRIVKHHGMSQSPEYRAWLQMRRRCSSQNFIGYHRYGGRGITVNLRWEKSFRDFYADMGPRPSSNHSLDRINNDGNYEPGNCRWATPHEQSLNRSTCRLITIGGVAESTSYWLKKNKIRHITFRRRIESGIGVDDALRKNLVVFYSMVMVDRDKLFSLLQSFGLSKTALAKKIGASDDWIRKIEKNEGGAIRIKATTAKMVAASCGVNMSHFLS